MARDIGSSIFTSTIQLKLQALLDPRGGVDKKAELYDINTWPHDGDVIYMKEGMLVTVRSEKSVYMLVDLSKILNTDYSGWLRMDTKVVDDLTSTDTDKALSANQGRLLNEALEEAKKALTTIYNFKGSCNYANLPTSGNSVGDVYNILDTFTLNEVEYPAGTNLAYAEDGSWYVLETSVDLSGYYTKEEVDATISTQDDKITETNETVATLTTKITTNESDITELSEKVDIINENIYGTDEETSDRILVRVEQLEDKDVEMLTKMTELENKATTLDGNLTTLANKVTELETNSDEQIEEIKTLINTQIQEALGWQETNN